VTGLLTIYWKELGDHFSSTRFIITCILVLLVSLIIAFMVGTGLKEGLQGIAKPSFVFLMLFTSSGKLFSLISFIAFFGPFMGILLGFDAMNRERSAHTLSKLVSQPIYRDSIINGKFLAGVVTIGITLLAIILLISGLGLLLVGVIPGPEEIWRLAIYYVISVFYISFWLALSILFSVVFRSMATSLFAAIACWIIFSYAVPFTAGPLGDALSPVDQQAAARNPEIVIQNLQMKKMVSLISPMTLYSEGTTTVLDPLVNTTQVRLMGPLERLSISRFQSPLPLSESVYLVFPHLISLIAITLVFFAISYLAFMRQEVRST
jgi:ABC-2 type transport system permease protein